MSKISEGTYKAKVVKWDICPLGKQENLFFIVDFKVVGPVDADPFPTQETRSIRRAMTKDGLDWLRSDLFSLGFKDSRLGRLDPVADDAHDFSNTEFVAECVHKERRDEVTNITKTYEEWRIQRPRKVATVEQKSQALSVLQELVDLQESASKREEPF